MPFEVQFQVPSDNTISSLSKFFQDNSSLPFKGFDNEDSGLFIGIRHGDGQLIDQELESSYRILMNALVPHLRVKGLSPHFFVEGNYTDSIIVYENHRMPTAHPLANTRIFSETDGYTICGADGRVRHNILNLCEGNDIYEEDLSPKDSGILEWVANKDFTLGNYRSTLITTWMNEHLNSVNGTTFHCTILQSEVELINRIAAAAAEYREEMHQFREHINNRCSNLKVNSFPIILAGAVHSIDFNFPVLLHNSFDNTILGQESTRREFLERVIRLSQN